MYILIQKCKKFFPILIFAILSNSLPAFSADKPQALVRNPDWNFGYVPQKSKVSHTFYLVNSGTAPLNVSKIKSGCSCTSISKIERPIAAGDSAAITITFNSGRFHKTVKKTTEIFTDDPDSSVLFLNIGAKVYKKKETAGDITMNPQKLTIMINEQGLIMEADSVEISNKGSDSVAVNILHISEIIINQIDIPQTINPNGKINPTLYLTKESLTDKIKGESIVFSFISQDTTFELKGLSMALISVSHDTTIVTVPIEIKK